MSLPRLLPTLGKVHWGAEVVERPDEAQIEILRTWGARLARDTPTELRAAGKAIVILIDELKRLQVNTQRAPGVSNTALIEASPSEDARGPIETVSAQSLGSSLRERLGAVIPNRATFDRGE